MILAVGGPTALGIRGGAAPVPFLDHGCTEPPGHGFTIGAVLLQPASTGTLTLISSDLTRPVAIDPGYLNDPDDLRRLVRGGQFAREMLATPSLAPHVGEPMRPAYWPTDELQSERELRNNAETLYHPVGDRPDGQRCRFRGQRAPA